MNKAKKQIDKRLKKRVQKEIHKAQLAPETPFPLKRPARSHEKKELAARLHAEEILEAAKKNIESKEKKASVHHRHHQHGEDPAYVGQLVHAGAKHWNRSREGKTLDNTRTVTKKLSKKR